MRKTKLYILLQSSLLPILTERILFIIALAASLYTVLAPNTYHTLDGPAHMHNAHLWKQLLFGQGDFLERYVEMSTGWVPNYASHILLGLFSTVLGMRTAHTLLLLILVIAIPFMGYAVLKRLGVANRTWGLVFFPLAFSGAFQMGFYNFSFGIFLWLVFSWFWLGVDRVTWRTALINFGLLIALYFTHAYLFVISGLTLVLWMGIHYGNRWKASPKDRKRFFQEWGWIAASSLLPAIGFILFWLDHPPAEETFLSQRELFDRLISMTSLISYHTYHESYYTKWLFFGLFALLAITSYRVIDIWMRTRTVHLTPKAIFPILALVVFGLYMSMPDSVGYASFISHRHQLLFFYGIAIWIASKPFPVWIRLGFGVLIVFVHLSLLGIVRTYEKPFQALTEDLWQARHTLPENSVIMPVNHSMRWECGHASNYLGADQTIVLLDNYELTLDYFPLRWNHEQFPKLDTNFLPCRTPVSNYVFPEGTGTVQLPTHIVYFSDEPQDWREACPELPWNRAPILFESPHVAILGTDWDQ